MGKNHRFLRIYTSCEIIDNHVVDIVLNMLSGVAIGNHLIIGYNDIGFDAHILQANTLLERAEVMPHVKSSRWTIACKHCVAFGMYAEIVVYGIACFKRSLIAFLIGHA